MIAFKLFKVRKDGSIGPLFINKRNRLPVGEWITAEDHPTKGYAHRPGWHCLDSPSAPHLSPRNRVWYIVEIAEYVKIDRPPSQGGVWFLANKMKIVEPVKFIS